MNEIQLEQLIKELSEVFEQNNNRNLRNYIYTLSQKLGINCISDDDNTIMVIPGSSNFEDTEPVIIQTHLDFNDTNINEQKAVLSNILLLLNNSFDHPKIYLVFSNKKYDGSKSIKKLDVNFIRDAKYLINVDSDLDQPFVLKTAGSEDIEIHYDYNNETVLGKLWILTIENVKPRVFYNDQTESGSAIQILAQALGHLVQTCQIRLVDFRGTSNENTLAQEAKACFYSPLEKDDILKQFVQIGKILATSYQFTDKDLKIDLKQQRNNIKTTCFSRKDSASIIFDILYLPTGTLLRDKAETLCSSNLYSCLASNGHLQMKIKTVFKSYSLREFIKNKILQFTAFTGGFGNLINNLPLWEAKDNSELVLNLKELFNISEEDQKGTFLTEGSVLQEKLPELEIISIGVKRQEKIDSWIYDTILSILQNFNKTSDNSSKIKVERTNGEIIPVTDIMNKLITEDQED